MSATVTLIVVNLHWLDDLALAIIMRQSLMTCGRRTVREAVRWIENKLP